MRPIATDKVAWSGCLSLSICCDREPCKTAEPIEMPVWECTLVCQYKHVLLLLLDGGTHWCQLANTIEPSICGSDAALCQLTLTTCYTVDFALLLGVSYFSCIGSLVLGFGLISNIRRHLCSPGRPSRWTLAHILVFGFGLISNISKSYNGVLLQVRWFLWRAVPVAWGSRHPSHTPTAPLRRRSRWSATSGHAR